MRFLSDEARQYLLDNGSTETVINILDVIMHILLDFTLIEGSTVESNIIFHKLAKALEYDMQMIMEQRGDTYVKLHG